VSPLFDSAPALEAERIVSLVPSITEALFALELGPRVVGVTDWCVHPADAVASLPKVGGTKNANIAAIAALAPDLVIANHEENTQRVVERLCEQGFAVWVTYPRTVREGVELLSELALLGATAKVRQRVVAPVDATLRDAEAALADSADAPRVLCPIWRDPWMAPGPDTYIHDLIRLCGGRNLHPEPRREAVSGSAGRPASARNPVPAGTPQRYPKLTLEEIVGLSPEVVLLPDEPYAFGEADAKELAKLDIPAAADGRIHCIDGTWVSWYGPRIRPAIRALRGLLA
jgi:ABC-type Fe3+-hydroxamate transport system substrate-binding protein